MAGIASPESMDPATFADLDAGAPYEDVFSTVDAGAVSALYGSAAKLTLDAVAKSKEISAQFS
ncbi:MAG TPA: hypothetical protein VFA45_22830 [Actinomycetes bacterium]|nr:hypothetical protein [Actinomycetes bacterium]